MDAECVYSINYASGTEIFSGKGTQKGTFFTWLNDCSSQDMIINTCEAVKNFNIVINDNSVTLKWEAPEAEGVVAYEIYRETILLGTTESLSYEDANLMSGSYTYNVRPVYESCNGATASQSVTFCEGVEEMFAPNVTIYPNPVNDKLFIETEVEIEEVVVYDIYGRQQTTVNGQQSSVINVSNLSKGVYFVNVKTGVGNVVKKIVKY